MRDAETCYHMRCHRVSRRRLVPRVIASLPGGTHFG